MHSRHLTRKIAALTVGTSLGLGAVVLGAAPAGAHVSPTTYGTTYTAGATNAVYLRVPHGCADAASSNGNAARTSKVITDIPATVTSLKPEARPGWTVSVTKNDIGAVTQVVWEARTFDDALPDYTWADFGLRGKLNGVAGDRIGFTTRQECRWHDDGTEIVDGGGAPTPLFEDWTGVNTPTVTLVGTANKVASADDLALLRGDVNATTAAISALTVRMTAAETAIAAIDGLVSRIGSLESGVSGSHGLDDRLDDLEAARTAATTALRNATSRIDGLLRTISVMERHSDQVEIGRAGGRVTVSVDLPSVRRGDIVSINVGGRRVGGIRLDDSGDGTRTFSGNAARAFAAGATVTITHGGRTLATTGA